MAILSYSAAEIDERLGKTDDIGDLSELETTDKDNLVDAVNELFTSVSDGKSAIAAAITDKGVPTAATDTFADMADNIGDIQTTPTLQTKSVTYTPSETQQTDTVTPSTGYDGLEEVDVTVNAISSSYVGSGVARKSSSDLTASGATVSVPAGYYENNASKAVASGSATPASSISATGASVSTGTNTLTLSKSVSNTPQVSAGYVSAGTAGNSSVSLTASVTTKAAATIHPSTSDQSIASGTYLTGAQTVKAVTLSNLSADNIKSGVTVKVGDSTDDDCVASVTGTYEGGGGSNYTKIASQDFTVNTSSTSVTAIGTMSLGSTAWTAAKIIYVRIRDKAGARNGYFVGSDNYLFNYMAASGATSGTNTVLGRQVYSKNTSGTWGASNSTYGVYAASLAADGTLTISARYNSTNSRTINGTYNVTVYTLDYAPDQGNPFNYSFL